MTERLLGLEGRSPVHGVLGSALPGLRLQEVADRVRVSEELGVGVKRHSVHPSRAPADLRALRA